MHPVPPHRWRGVLDEHRRCDWRNKTKTVGNRRPLQFLVAGAVALLLRTTRLNGRSETDGAVPSDRRHCCQTTRVSATRARPVLPSQVAHSAELPRVRRDERRSPPTSLAGQQHVVRAIGFPSASSSARTLPASGVSSSSNCAHSRGPAKNASSCCVLLSLR
jgi:hypothetical protein